MDSFLFFVSRAASYSDKVAADVVRASKLGSLEFKVWEIVV